MQVNRVFWALARLAFSLCVSVSMVAHWEPVRHQVFFLALFAVSSWLISTPLFAWLSQTLPAIRTWKAAAIALALSLVGFAMTYAIPIPVAPSDNSVSPVEIEVRPLGPSPHGGLGSEVWFAIEADGVRVPLDQIRHDATWQIRDGMLYATQAGTPARWSGRATSLQVVALAHPWSGRAQLSTNGHAQVIDLYQPTGGNAYRSIWLLGDANPQLWMQFAERSGEQRAVQVLDALLIAFALFVLHLWFTSLPSSLGDTRVPLWRDSLRYALPSWAISALLLIVFWPGVMSNDSIDQWHMAGTTISSDWHPVFHTLLISLARKIWDTPGFVAMLQAGALGLSSGYLIAVTQRVTRTSSRLAHAASWGCALMPMIAFSSITLWKDIPYAASVVAITAGVTSVLFLGSPRLGRLRNFAAALAVLLVCILFRHNGPPIALAALLIVFVLSPANRKAAAVLGLCVFAIAMVLKGPVTDSMGVKRSNVAFTLYSHHIAAHLESGEHAPTPAAKTLFRQIVKDGDTWPYRCSVVDITIFNSRFDIGTASHNSTELRDTWLQMARENPGTELRHLACVSSLVWLMDESSQAPLYEAGPSIHARDGQQSWVQAGPEVREASLTPHLVQPTVQWLEFTRQFNLLWRPAAWLYLLIFAACVAATRMKDWRVALVTVPVLVHSAVLAVANVAQDSRYQLPVFVIALAMAPALLRASSRREGEEVLR